jgi:hypothetical protein
MNIELSGNYHFNRRMSEQARELDVGQLFAKIRTMLSAKGYPEKSNYSLGDEKQDDCLLFCEDGEFWVVTYVERGVRFSPAFFLDIDDAIHFFLWKLTDGDVVSI